MSRPRYKLSKFQIVGDDEGMAVADCEIIYDGKTIPFKKPLRKENKHDVDLLLAIDKFVCKENFNQEV
ncbi:hypothetical protein C7Y47_24025 [Lysinibacillus sphaericus]|uniref:Uncharacterized protein n=1 Tax=Lysinibacillus sphaericus TaxID=1421 RepID=A0A544U7C4_LYSSH|nr:hypothetical protein [Lysinibacillus sp. SDF0037]TQR26857.1 hypothetical protein C7Y47_24025 [Lysinibacillus sp. SDF0037]